MHKIIVIMNEELVKKLDQYAEKTSRDRSKTIRYACERLVGEVA